MRLPFIAPRAGTLVTSVASVALAVLATQHHTLHMLVIALGAGSAGMAFMEAYPVLRRGMLLISLAMVAIMVARLGRQPRLLRPVTGLSIGLTLGLVAWSVFQFGP